MKKAKVFLASVLTMIVAITGVNAEQNTEYTISNPLPGALEITQDENYVNAGSYKIDRVKVVVKVNKDNVNAILAQTPGNTEENGKANLGVFYFGLEPKVLTSGKKINKEYSEQKITGAYEDALEKAAREATTKADSFATSKKYDKNTSFWNLGVQINYNKDGVWTKVTNTADGDGTISIGENLKNLLKSDSSITAADYGKKFIFSVPEDKAIVWAYRIADDDEGTGKTYHYATIDYDIEFPITASNGSNGYYFLSLEDAIKDSEELGITDVTINKDTTVKEDVVIPEGLNISVSKGAKLGFEGNVTFEKGATISGSVEYAKGKEAKYAVDVDTTKNGKVEVDKKTAKKGEIVTIKTTASEGYELDKIVVKDKNGKEIKVTDSKFTMPDSYVTVTASFKKIAVESSSSEENPNTYDNIITYVVIAMLGVSAIALGLKRKNVYNK